MRIFASSICAAALLIAPAAAFAGSLEIGPVGISMIGKERTSTVTVRNTSADPMNLQVRTVDWVQKNGDDTYSPSQNLVASPPFFTLAPGQAQTVRVVVNKTPDSPTEIAWRLIIDELPPPSTGATGVVVPLRALVPVFLAPSTSARPKLRWSAASSSGKIALDVANEGTVHDRLSDLTATSGGKTVSGPDPLFGYVLAGSNHPWALSGAAAGSPISVAGQGAFGPIKAELTVSN
jgi:fimbrial chaperone protein